MSYKDKNQIAVRCGEDSTCEAQANRLTLIRGVPVWVCEPHWSERQPRSQR